MSQADLAYEVRKRSNGKFKTSDRGVRGWERGDNNPRDGVVAIIAAATGHPIEFFYTETEGADDASDEELKLQAANVLELAGRPDLADVLRHEVRAVIMRQRREVVTRELVAR